MRRGFTLVELLLVVAIVFIVVAIGMPSFVNSMKGNRLRTAGRSVVTSGRYARSMALLQQRTMVLTFDLNGSRLSVQPAAKGGGGGAVPGGAAGAEPAGGAEPGAAPTVDPGAEPGVDPGAVRSGGGGDSIERKLEGVRIVRVEIPGSQSIYTEGKCSVLYRSNGRCSPYVVRIEDDEGGSLVVEVDALASAQTTQG